MGSKDTELGLDVGQANELKLALRKAGYTNADVKRMCEGKTLAEMLPVIRGHAKITMVQHVIHCDADPFIPKGWQVEEHDCSLGQLELDMSKIELHLSADQKDSKTSKGNKLRKELENKKVLNANVLDWLLNHTELIPDEWKKKGSIFFWGTIYRYSDGRLYVRCLDWHGDRWRWVYSWLDGAWGSGAPAAVLAS